MVLIFRDVPYPKSSFQAPVVPPDVEPTDGEQVTVCFSAAWFPYVLGALTQLTLQSTWKTESEEDTYLAMRRGASLIEQLVDPACALTEAETPYWDDDTDVDDSAPSELQQWFGFVTEPLAPPGELDFVESMALWLFTGFVMFSSGPGAAIYFKTNAPKFYITVRDTNIVELIRIIVDGQEVGTVTTPGTNSGEIDVPVIADPTVTTGHEIYVVRAA